MNPEAFVLFLKYALAVLPGAAMIAASTGLDWLDGLTPMQGLGSGAVVVSLAFLMYRVVIQAFNRADEIQHKIISDLRTELERVNRELAGERALRVSLENAGIKDRRRSTDEQL